MATSPLYERDAAKFYEDRLLFGCLIVATGALFFSFTYEYVMKEEPCRLCNLQRPPYILILSFSIIGLTSSFRKLTLKIIQLFFVGSLILASYHFAIQTGLISDTCAVPQNIHSLDAFKQILEKNSKPCSAISWSFFGIPISAYNVGVSLFFSIIFMKHNFRKSTFRPVREISDIGIS